MRWAGPSRPGLPASERWTSLGKAGSAQRFGPAEPHTNLSLPARLGLRFAALAWFFLTLYRPSGYVDVGTPGVGPGRARDSLRVVTSLF